MSNTTSTPTAPGAPHVGVVGVGSMGLPMALSLLMASKAGTVAGVWLHSRRRNRAQAALHAGAGWCHTPADLASRTSVVVVALPALSDIEEILDGDDGLLRGVGADPLHLVVTSTCAPEGLRRLAHRLERHQPRVVVIDAPVSGGVEGARARRLSIMVGSAGRLTAEVRAVLAALGEAVELGPVGTGQVAKACNQMIVGATSLAIAEAAVVAERSGLDLATVLPVLARGYAASAVLTAKLPKLLARDYSPDGRAAFMKRDLEYARDEARRTATATAQLDVNAREFAALVDAGLGDQDLAVTHRHIELKATRP